MSGQKPQGEEAPVIVAEQVAEKPVIEPQTPAQAETTQTIPNAEWQQMQESIRALNQKLSQKNLEEFERENPIVTTEKYKVKWDDLKKQKEDPQSKYHKLTHEELLRLIREPEIVVPKPTPQIVSVPSLNPSVSPDTPSGKVDPEARKWLEAYYGKDRVDATEAA